MRLPLTILVDDDVDVKPPAPPAGNPNADIDMLQPNTHTVSTKTTPTTNHRFTTITQVKLSLTSSVSQSVQNAAARLILNLRRCDHINDVLISLHWLCVPERIIFKVATLTYRALHGSAPPYLASSFTSVADMPHRRRLRSASIEQFDIPTCRRSTIGGRAFPVAGAKVWYSLPSDVTSASSLPVFKNRLVIFVPSLLRNVDSELHYFFLVIISPPEQWSLQ